MLNEQHLRRILRGGGLVETVGCRQALHLLHSPARCRFCTPGYGNANCPGACGADAAACRVPGLDAAPIALTAEGECSAASQGTVTVVSIEYYPPECTCLAGGICTEPEKACSTGDGNGLPHESCDEGDRCAGLCMPAEDCSDADWVGLECEVLVEGQSCTGELQCINGSATCDASACVGSGGALVRES